METASYHDIRHTITDACVVLFDEGSGKKKIGKIISAATGSPWVHCGLVVRTYDADRIMLLESTLTEGVHLSPLSDRIAEHKGRVAIRRLLPVLSPTRIALFETWWLSVLGFSYEHSALELILAACDLPFCRNVKDETSFFCSELGAAGLDAAGLRPKGLPSNEYTPADFARDLPLLDGFRFLPLVELRTA